MERSWALPFTQEKPTTDFSGGLVTFQNFFSLPPNATPNSMDVRFTVGGGVEKRLGSTTLNATLLVSNTSTGFSPDSAGTIASAVTAYWKLDEQSGTRFDEFGTYNLTQFNTVSFVAGVGGKGNAANFVLANSQYLAGADDLRVRSGAYNYEMAAWVNLTTKTAPAKTVISKRGNSVIEYALQYDDVTDRFQFLVWNSAQVATAVSDNALGSPSTSTWYLLFGRRDSTNGLINIQVNTFAAASATFIDPSTGGTGRFGIGAGPNDGGTPLNFMNGSIDEAGFWRGTLTAQNRIDLYNAGNANTYTTAASFSGWGMFDFGAGFVNGTPLRWLVASAGTGIYASSDRFVTFVVIATDRKADYQEFERSKSYLIAVSNTYNQVLYWAGSVGTFMAGLAPGSAPPAKHALDFNGFLLLMNDSGGKRRITYADNTKLLTDPWTSNFEISSSYDDEITAGIVYNRAAYVCTKYTCSRVSAVGGNPDFATQQVKHWGAVPGTLKKVTLPDLGEVMIALGWDRHVRIFDGINDRIISAPIEQNNGQCPAFLSGIPPEYLHRCKAEVDTEDQVYRLWIVMSPSQQTTHCMCFDLRTQAWYPYANQNFNAAVMAESGNSRIFAGVKRDGYVHWINTTNRDGTTAIPDYFDSPLMFTTPRTVTKYKKLTFYFRPTSSGTLFMQDRTDFLTGFNPVRQTVALADTTTVLVMQKTVDVPVTQNVYQYRWSSSASTANPWMLIRTDTEHYDLGLGKA